MPRPSLFSTVVLLVTIVFGTGPALADCVYNGQSYPEGTRIGVHVCENGQWVLRP
jgi:hypothetical protein